MKKEQLKVSFFIFWQKFWWWKRNNERFMTTVDKPRVVKNIWISFVLVYCLRLDVIKNRFDETSTFLVRKFNKLWDNKKLAQMWRSGIKIEISKDTFSSSFLEEQNLKNEYGLPLCHAGMPLIVWEESGKFEIWINLCRKIKWKKKYVITKSKKSMRIFSLVLYLW